MRKAFKSHKRIIKGETPNLYFNPVLNVVRMGSLSSFSILISPVFDTGIIQTTSQFAKY